MISLLKQDSCENRNEIQKDARRGRSIVDGALFIVGLWLLWNSGLGIRAKIGIR
jgi:hypothetical protein